MDADDILFFKSWPPVPLNRNQSEKEIFAKYFSIIDKNKLIIQMLNLTNDEIVKNKDEATSIKEQGNICYNRRENEAALKLYNKSLCLAPRDSTEFGLAVANRSAVLLDMEKYKECLEDINLILNSEYPKDLLYKIYIRQSKCFMKLNMNFEAARSIRKAQEINNKQKLNKTEKASRNDKIMEISNELKQQLKIKLTDNQSTDRDNLISEPVLKDGENPNFVNASNVIEYRNIKKRGRYVVAKTEIKKGDILFVEEPHSYISLNREKDNSDICVACFKRVLNYVPCTNCITHVYCSDKCRQHSWDLNHGWTCFGGKQKIVTCYEQFLALAMLFKASRDGFKTTGTKENKNNNTYINQLLTNKDKVSENILKIYVQFSVWMVKYLKNFTDYFDWLYLNPNRPDGSKEDLYIFVGGQLVKFLLQIGRNVIPILEKEVLYSPIEFKGLQTISTGWGIFTSTALLNHSCKPNTVQSFYGTKIVIRALNNIKKGTEITRNYLRDDYFCQSTEERQLKLQIRYITCTCEVCTDLKFDERLRPLLCLRCGGKIYITNLQCGECYTFGNIMYYISNVEKITQLFTMLNLVNNNKELLDKIYQLMKITFHEQNIGFLKYYNRYIKYIKGTDGIKKCVTIAKKLKDLHAYQFEDINKYHLVSSVKYIFFLINYCIILKKFHSNNYKKHYNEALKEIQECEDIMQYFLNPNEIKRVVDDLKKYLNSDSIEIEDGGFMLEELE